MFLRSEEKRFNKEFFFLFNRIKIENFVSNRSCVNYQRKVLSLKNNKDV